MGLIRRLERVLKNVNKLYLLGVPFGLGGAYVLKDVLAVVFEWIGKFIGALYTFIFVPFLSFIQIIVLVFMAFYVWKLLYRVTGSFLFTLFLFTIILYVVSTIVIPTWIIFIGFLAIVWKLFLFLY